MRQKTTSLTRSEEDIFPSAFSPLDKDILELFSINEKGSTDNIRSNKDLVEQVKFLPIKP